jgi:hypothetical protein
MQEEVDFPNDHKGGTQQQHICFTFLNREYLFGLYITNHVAKTTNTMH